MRHFNFNQTFAKSLDTELDRLDALLSRQESRIRAAFGEFVAGAQSEAAVKEAADLLAKGDVEGALKVVDRYVARLASVLPTVYQQAAAVELVAIGEQLAPLLPTVAVSFDPTDTRAAMVMRSASLEFIRGFTAGQRDATRQALTQAFMDGSGTAATARAFRDSIGLTAYQEQAVRNYRNLLEQGSRQALDRALRDRRFDRTVTRAADGGDPLTAEQIDRMVARYRANYLAYRAKTIARTEALTAVSQARDLAFEQNRVMAGISTQAISSTWRTNVDGRERETHHDMNGQVQPYGSAFQSPSGATLRYPGDPLAPAAERVACRCHRTFRIDPTALEIPA